MKIVIKREMISSMKHWFPFMSQKAFDFFVRHIVNQSCRTLCVIEAVDCLEKK